MWKQTHSPRLQLETIRIDLHRVSRSFVRIRQCRGRQSDSHSTLRFPLSSLPFPWRTSRSRARFIARTWEISGLAACRASLIKVYGRIVESHAAASRGRKLHLCFTPEGTRAITVSFVTVANHRCSIRCAISFLSPLPPPLLLFSKASKKLPHSNERFSRKAKGLLDAKFASMRSN